MAFKQILLAMAFLLAGFSPASAETFRIVGLGDSLMAGYGLRQGEGYPAKLEAALRARGHDVAVEDAGVSGDTTAGGLARLDWSVPDGTDLVILELGANDMLRGVSPQVAERNLDAMITRLKARNIPVLLAGMRAAPNWGPDYVERFDGIFPRLAKKHGVALYPFFLEGLVEGGRIDRALLLEDNLHPSAAGIDRIVRHSLPAVEALLPEKTAG
ncbi:MAG TPA: arylesterase [Mesorhizobium sp.]|jgi:acyl-CoA thioesterase-1|nr:arylesterase [Mesorhizobium sp.]